MPLFIGVQWPSAEAARAGAKGDLHLRFCAQCGFIWNSRFEPARMEYTQRYDNALDFSPVFREFAQQLATRLIDTYGIRHRHVVEIGCGKGHFLTLLCELGDNRGTGFDPSYEGARMPSAHPDRITYIQDLYGEQYTQHRGDLICCRHVFEHIPEPVGFLSNVRRTIGDHRDAVVYFEVPNVRFILEQHSIWDIIYEHCNYFGRESLTYVFQQAGFEVLRLEETYRGQFLSLDARLNPDATMTDPGLGPLTRAVERFAEQVRRQTHAWQERLAQWQATQQRVVLWGGGAKAVSFLNLLGIGDAVPYVVDINPHKQGLHLAGTGQKVVAPAFLREYRPDQVILVNPIYREEVARTLSDLGVTANLVDA